MTEVPAWRRLGEYVTMDRTVFFSNKKYQQPQLLQIFFLAAFLENTFIRNIIILHYELHNSNTQQL